MMDEQKIKLLIPQKIKNRSNFKQKIKSEINILRHKSTTGGAKSGAEQIRAGPENVRSFFQHLRAKKGRGRGAGLSEQIGYSSIKVHPPLRWLPPQLVSFLTATGAVSVAVTEAVMIHATGN